MKKIVVASLMMACMPFLAMAQSVEDDLYFIPKKKTEKKEEVKQEIKVTVPQKRNTTTVYAAPGSTVVVKDVKGNTRDVDEYNRRYTSRDNNFSMENDTLYIEEKPLNERGEWVNGFEGSQDDYEYAMRIVRFRNPRYAIPVSSPLYWDVVYALPSWEWNVYDDGLYAYAFPTYTNRLWWDWRFNYPYGAGWGLNWGWSSPWYYNSWYPNYWYGGYWGGGYWGHHPWHNHYYPSYGWGGGYWGGGHGWNGSSARHPGIHAGRYNNNYNSARPNRNNYVNNYGRTNSNSYVGRGESGRTSSNRYRSVGRGGSSSGRVVSGSDQSTSVRPGRTTYRSRTGENISVGQSGVRNENTYSRPEAGRGSSYNRPSSTRSSVSGSSSYQRNSNGTVGRGAYRTNSNNSSSRSNSYSRGDSYSRNNSSSRSTSTSRNNSSYRSNSSSSSSSRSSYSSGSSSSSRSSGGSSRSSGGGGGSRRR